MRRLGPGEDAFGQALLARLEGRPATAVVERDDGFVVAEDPAYYFAPFRRWWLQERRALRFARGTVLDVGCAAGRVALELQARGHEVVALDVSPGAVEVARRRGVRDVRVGTVEGLAEGERFETILLLGNNLFLLGDERRGRTLLRRLAAHAEPGGRLLGGSYDPDDGANATALAYHERNRARGRPAGAERLRVRYRDLATPWFDALFLSREELRAIAAGTGWEVERFVDDGAGYVGVLRRARAPR